MDTSYTSTDTSVKSLDDTCTPWTSVNTSCTSLNTSSSSVITSSTSVDTSSPFMDRTFTCTVCLDMFTDPRSLPCKHSLCMQCMQTHLNAEVSKERRTFSCPDCRKTFKLPDKVKQIETSACLFKRNLTLGQAIHAFKELQRSVASIPDERRGSLPNPPTGQQTNTSLIDKRKDRLKHIQTFNSRTSADENDVEINSMLVLHGEATRIVVVSDWGNKCIKCFSSETKELMKSYTFLSRPCGLAKSRDQPCGAVVALPLLKRIQYLDIQDDVRLTHTLKTKRMYYFIFVLSDNRIIASGWRQGGYVDILNPLGQVIKNFPPRVIPDPWSLVVRGHSMLVISRRGESVTCMTPIGTFMWLPCDPTVEHHLVSVASDLDEYVYVCDEVRQCVTQLTRDGKVIRNILTQQDQISVPVAIYCDHNEIYVAQSNGDVCIYSWTKS